MAEFMLVLPSQTCCNALAMQCIANSGRPAQQTGKYVCHASTKSTPGGAVGVAPALHEQLEHAGRQPPRPQLKDSLQQLQRVERRLAPRPHNRRACPPASTRRCQAADEYPQGLGLHLFSRCNLNHAVLPPSQVGPLMSPADAVGRSWPQLRTGGGRRQQRGKLVLRLEQLLQQRLALRRPQDVQEAQEVGRVLQMCSGPSP